MLQLKHRVFWPPFIVLLLSAIYSLIDGNGFIHYASLLNQWLLQRLGWLFAVVVLVTLILCLIIYFSPLGKVKIGGKNATPKLSKWQWFSITLCSTIATGILFWGTAEPIFHLHEPPESLGLNPGSRDAASFALSTMYMHWTFTPYSIYTVAGVAFALVYYNLKQPYSLGSLLYPLLGKRAHGSLGSVIDSISLYSLVAGMAASLGAGILTISGGLESTLGLNGSNVILGLIALGIVLTFVLSSASGLMRGIRLLSDINTRIFFVFAIVFLFAGPTWFILSFGLEGLWEYIVHFVPRSIYSEFSINSDWARSWPLFNWANWMAWTPVTALFLGSLSYGYSVRQFIIVNLLLPSLFGIVWMAIFSGSVLEIELTQAGQPLYGALKESGAEQVMYKFLEQFPFSDLIILVFLGISFLSYVTAADSNTTAMSGISAEGISPSSPEPSMRIKIIWGITVGVISWVMVSYAGIDGIKLASSLGGFPALFLILGIGIGVVYLIKNSGRLVDQEMDS